MTETYQLAGRLIRVSSVWPDVHRLCRPYRAEGTPDFALETTPADAAFERERSAREDARAGRSRENYTDGYLETLAVYRKIAEKMPDFDTVLFHGSCVAVDGAGYLFTAKSGTGKSTHTRLWRELLGPRALMVNDDKPLLRIGGEGTAVFGTPWDGKHRLSSNISVPLRGLCILERAEENTIRPLTAREAYPMLLQQVYRPADGDALAKTLALTDRLAASAPLWRLGCNQDLRAAQVAYEAMRG